MILRRVYGKERILHPSRLFHSVIFAMERVFHGTSSPRRSPFIISFLSDFDYVLYAIPYGLFGRASFH